MRPLVDLLPVQRHVLVFTAGDTVTAMRKTATSMGQRQTGILEGVERNGLKDGASPHTSGAKPSAVDASEVLIKEVYRVSPWYRSRLLFLVVPETEHTVLHFFGVRLVDLPQVVVVDMSDPDDPRRYAMQASHVKGVFGGGYIDSDELPPEKPGTTPPPRPPLPSPPPEKLAGFLDDLLGGKLSPSLKSQSPISPASASASAPGTGKTAGAGTSDSSSSSRSSGSRACSSDELSSRVVRLTAREFQARVVEMAGDVLLMFHSPWCGHCKSMQAILADTADFYTSHLPDAPLVFARMDAIKNEIRAPGVHINGYPTIYLFLSSNKSQPVEYLGARNVPAIVRFLAKHTPHIVNPVDDVDESKNVAVDTQ
jgi:thiol-disulfide isomerase/thioredoxin